MIFFAGVVFSIFVVLLLMFLLRPSVSASVIAAQIVSVLPKFREQLSEDLKAAGFWSDELRLELEAYMASLAVFALQSMGSSIPRSRVATEVFERLSEGQPDRYAAGALIVRAFSDYRDTVSADLRSENIGVFVTDREISSAVQSHAQVLSSRLNLPLDRLPAFLTTGCALVRAVGKIWAEAISQYRITDADRR